MIKETFKVQEPSSGMQTEGRKVTTKVF